MTKFWSGNENRLRGLDRALAARMGLPRASRPVGVPGMKTGPETTGVIDVYRTTQGDFQARIPEEAEMHLGIGGIPAHDETVSRRPVASAP